MARQLIWVLVFACGCGAEFRIGAGQGIKPVLGDARTTLDGFTCGQPLQSEGYAVSSQSVGADCRFTFDRDVTVISQDDYAHIDGFGVANLVKAIELQVKSLDFVDESTGMALSLQTQVKEASFAVNGQVLLTRDELAVLPRWVRLEGAALDSLRAQIDARQTATVHVSAMVLVSPPLPKHLTVHYEIQPELVVGPR